MPTYSYKAKNLKGEEESGTIEAQDKEHLTRIIRQKGYFLVSVEEAAGAEKRKFDISRLNIFARFIKVGLTEKLFFTRNLMVMIKAGVPLPRAFKMLASQAKSKKFKEVLNEISEQVIKGKSLSESLGSFAEVFPLIYQETVKVGEETGKLDEALGILGSQMEREHRLKARIKTAMVYPIMILGITFAIGAFMMAFAVPKLKAAFEDLGVKLPFTTRAILGFADFVTKKWLIAFLVAAVLIFVSVTFLRTRIGKKLKARLSLSIPIVSKVVKQTNSTLALRTLSSLMEAGVPIVRSLEAASGALTNFYFRESLVEAAKVVEKGGKLSQALKPYEGLYPSMVLQMLEVGEETGETSGILEKLADFYEEEVTATTQKLSSIIEPILIVVIGAGVGFFAISMMQPMFSVMGGIQ